MNKFRKIVPLILTLCLVLNTAFAFGLDEPQAEQVLHNTSETVTEVQAPEVTQDVAPQTIQELTPEMPVAITTTPSSISFSIDSYNVSYPGTTKKPHDLVPEKLAPYTNVYFVQFPGISKKNQLETIEGTLPSPNAKISIKTPFPDDVYDITYKDGKWKSSRKLPEKNEDRYYSINKMTGPRCVFITVTDNQNTYTYYLIYNYPKGSGSFSDNTDNCILADAHTGVSLDEFSDDPRPLRSINASTDSVYVQLSRESKKPAYDRPETRTSNNLVILNGEEIYNFDAATPHRGGSGKSPTLYLKKGLNVLEIKTGDDVPRTFTDPSLSSEDTVERIYVQYQTSYSSAIYLINYDGEPAAEIGNSNTDIEFLSADLTYSGGTTLKQNYKTVIDNETKTHSISLPQTMPVLNKLTQACIYLGIKTEDPGASYKIVVPEGSYIQPDIKTRQYGLVVTDHRLGIFTYVYAVNPDGSNINSFDIEVTASDRKTKTIHTVNFVRGDGSAEVSEFSIQNANLANGIAFNSEKNNYQIKVVDDNLPVILSGKIPVGATLHHKGKPVSLKEDNSFSIQIMPSENITSFTVTAQDTISKKIYYFLRETSDGRIPYINISEDSKAFANDLLWGWKKTISEAKAQGPLNISGSYWQLFANLATGEDVKNSYVYDVTKHTFKQTTDYAAVILELVMVGENPYNFRGRNYVQEMVDNGGGPFACNIWYLMAAKTVGVDASQFIPGIKATATAPAGSYTDMRGWALAALNNVLPQEDLAAYADMFNNEFNTEGKFAGLFRYPGGFNMNTQGCMLSGLTSVGVDAHKLFTAKVDGQIATPLTVVKDHFMTSDGKFWRVPAHAAESAGFTQDLVIALGDIALGSNVWDRYTLTRTKFDALVSKAEALKSSGQSNTQIETALSAANSAASKVSSTKIIGLGKAYYDLFEAVATVDTSMKLNVTFGGPELDFIKLIDSISEPITIQDKIKIGEASAIYETWKPGWNEIWDNVLGLNNVKKYRNAQKSIIQLEGGENAATTFEKILALPDAKIITLNDKAQIVAAKTSYQALNAEQKSLIAWSGKTVVAKLTDAEAMLAKLEGNGGKPTADSCTVSFTLIGDSKHGESNHDKFEDWIPAKNFTFNAKTITVGEVFLRALNEAGFEHIGYEKNYISKINGPSGWLGEFDNGKNSGWMYTVNGSHPNVGLRDYIAKDGDVIVWHYTDNYTQEEGSEKWGNKPYAPEASVKDGSVSVNTEATAKTDANGKATANISASDLKDALEKITKSLQDSKEKNTLGKLNLNVKADAKATLVQTSLPKEALSEIAKTKNTELTLNTPLGNLTLDTKALESLVKASGGSEVKITIGLADNSKLNDDMKKAVQTSLLDRPLYDLTISSNNQNITTFGDGKLIASVPYTLKENEKAENVVIYHVDKTGKLNLIIDSKYIASEKRVEFTTTHLSYYAVGYNENTKKAEDTLNYNFNDIKDGAWYKEAVDYVLKEKLMSGINANEFGPNKSMTRGMFVTVLGRMSGDLSFDNPDTVNSLSKKAETRFKDIKTRQYYAPYVAWATENNIASGLSENSFAPNEAITREQLAVLLHNYTKQNDKDRATVTENSIAGLNKFKDVSKISPWAKDSMQWAVEKGILAGYNEQLNPKSLATRAELASILKKYSELP